MTKSLEDYIEEIHLLIRDNGQARVRDVARAIGVKMPSVVKAIAELKKLGLVTQEPYESIKLTEEGSRVAAMVLERHTILKAFLLKLGVGEANAEKAVYHARVLEELCKMAYITELVNPKVQRLKDSLIQKHYNRKHGKDAYYGQN